MRLFYHASNHQYEKPDLASHMKNVRSFINGNSYLGLFCNTDPTGSSVYGEHLYSFRIAKGAVTLEVENEMRQAGRCAEYYRGVRDALLLMGVDVITTTYEEGVSAIILNFDVIEGWKRAGEAP